MVRAELPSSVPSVFSKCDVIDFTSQAEQAKIQSLLYLKDLNKIACFHQNGLITLYEADTHYPARTFKAHNGGVTASYYHAKKKRLITQYIGEIKIWDLTHVRFNQLSAIIVDFSIPTAIELLKKKNRLIVAGEHKCWKTPNILDTMLLVDIESKETVAKWQDKSGILTMQKVRYGTGNYVILCGFANGLMKMFSCENKFNCLRSIRAHQGKINKLHVTRINDHPYCISESDDKKITLWNVNSKITSLRTFRFPQKTLIGGTYYNHKVLILIQEYGTQVIFVNLLKGNTFKRVDVGVSTITRGLAFGKTPKVAVVLDIAKLVYLGIKN